MHFSRGLTVVPSLPRCTARLGIALMTLAKLQGDLCVSCQIQHLCQLPWQELELPQRVATACRWGCALQQGWT